LAYKSGILKAKKKGDSLGFLLVAYSVETTEVVTVEPMESSTVPKLEK
jgi:hypothetical protein